MRLLSGKTENSSLYHLEIVSENPDFSVVIHAEEAQRANLAVLFGWKGWHAVSLVSHSVSDTG